MLRWSRDPTSPQSFLFPGLMKTRVVLPGQVGRLPAAQAPQNVAHVCLGVTEMPLPHHQTAHSPERELFISRTSVRLGRPPQEAGIVPVRDVRSRSILRKKQRGVGVRVGGLRAGGAEWRLCICPAFSYSAAHCCSNRRPHWRESWLATEELVRMRTSRSCVLFPSHRLLHCAHLCRLAGSPLAAGSGPWNWL